LKITFLGTGTSQGIRSNWEQTPVCLSKNQKGIKASGIRNGLMGFLQLCIDCGPDFRQQMLTNMLKKLMEYCFTHEHSDQYGGNR